MQPLLQHSPTFRHVNCGLCRAVVASLSAHVVCCSLSLFLPHSHFRFSLAALVVQVSYHARHPYSLCLSYRSFLIAPFLARSPVHQVPLIATLCSVFACVSWPLDYFLDLILVFCPYDPLSSLIHLPHLPCPASAMSSLPLVLPS